MNRPAELEQTAVVAAESDTPPAVNNRAVSDRPRLHYGLSVEHAALFATLSLRGIDLIVWLGQGLSTREIAQRMHITRWTADGYLKALRKKTRLSTRSLAIMGYELAAQVEKRAAERKLFEG